MHCLQKQFPRYKRTIILKTQMDCIVKKHRVPYIAERSILSQFRAGILPLRIETGRYVGEPAELRHCTLCKPDVPRVENE